MRCPVCMVDNPDDAGFCASCGAASGGESSFEVGGKGLGHNAAAIASYALAFVTGLVFYLLERDNVYVRFHALQSVVLFGTLTIVALSLRVLALMPSFIGVVFIVLMWAMVGIGVLLWALLMLRAYQGKRFILPLAGEFAERETYGRIGKS